jgi:AraC-like DNA-binding protein
MEKGTLMRSFGLTFTQPILVPPSSTDWHQFVVATRAPLTLSTDGATWLVPPGAAFWIPAGLGCSFRNRGQMSVSMLYLPAMPMPSARFSQDSCAVLGVSPLLKELVGRVVIIGALVERDPRHRRLAAMVWDELADAETISAALPQPASLEACKLIETLEQQGFRLDALESAVRRTGCSRRTLERVFLRETQMSLGVWLRKRRLLLAMERLMSRDPVSDVAFDLGYNGPSAFIAMVRRETGRTPRELQVAGSI